MALFSGDAPNMGSALPSSAALAAPWIQWLARLGYAARGVVYVVIGALALQAAISAAQRPEDSSGALQAMRDQPLGRVLLGAVAVGLVGWVVWRLVQAIRDPEGKGSDAKGLAKRAGYLVSAAIYGGLALEAARMLMGRAGGGEGGDAAAEHWTAMALAQPTGRWLIVAVGAGIVLFGFYELYRGYTARFRRKLDLSSLGADGQKRVVFFGRLGMAARGIVFGIIGWFLIQAALQYDPEEAQGFETALATLEEQGYGQYLLGAVAIGLMAYGLFELAEARYRVIRTA